MSAPTSPADLVILGGGSGGYAARSAPPSSGMTVVLIEKDKVGGTCLHRGCIPTKALLHAGEVADLAREGEQFGVKTSLAGIDMDGVNAYKDGVVAKLYKGLQGLVKSRKITYVEGEGRLASPTAVEVNGQTYEGKHVLLATGSYARIAARPRDRRHAVITSDHALQPRPGPGLGDRPRRRRHRLRVRQRLEVLRRRRHHRRGAAAPGAARGRGLLQAARARVPPPQDRLRARQPLLRRPDTPTTASRSRSRTARRSRPSCCSSPSAAARSARASATRRPASPWTAASSSSTSTAGPTCPTISAVGDLIPTLQLAHVGFGEGILVAERHRRPQPGARSTTTASRASPTPSPRSPPSASPRRRPRSATARSRR